MRRLGAVATACVVASAVVVGHAAGAEGRLAAPCVGDALKPKVRLETSRRVAVLGEMMDFVGRRADPYGLNAAHVETLRRDREALQTLEARITSVCYGSLAEFRADAERVFVDYRVYWLRLPQTYGLAAADWLAQARAALGAAADKLEPLAASNAQAMTALGTMRDRLAAADGRLGAAPTPAPILASAVALRPARDMTANDAALRALHQALVATRAELVAAHAAGLEAIAAVRAAAG